MRNTTKRSIEAFMLAPLAPPTILWAFGTNRSFDALLLAFCVVGLGWSYPLTLAIGLPLYFLIGRRSLRLWHVLASSGVVGFLPIFACWGDAIAASCGAALGLIAGITFWLVWYRRPSETAPP
jgi:hypothetical protein